MEVEVIIRALEIIILFGTAIVMSAFAIFILCIIVSCIIDKIKEVKKDDN